MALSRRVKITLAGAGLAGVALVTAGGTALAAGPDGGMTELQIVDRHGAGTAAAAESVTAPDEDCPEKTASATGAVDTR
ncbi:hypothetical protein [Actinomadura alba]|uniref:Uncharacterized protein n=1 Tax=Actinomadura alba TaxID=406431 RepID=A0ABR7LH11_9ACTN|nr:hypothetical protein [Actinomadura alba]MBC6464117.1 hypothetical protein [Actinomadura alba]